jgi:protease-4
MVINLQAQDHSFYYKQNKFALTSPGAMKFGLYGYVNPAVLNTMNQFDLLYLWSDAGGIGRFLNWGLYTAVPHFGFSAVHTSESIYTVTDFKLSAAIGSKAFSIGFGYGWSSGDKDFFDSPDVFTLGTLFRPDRYLSLGLTGNLSTEQYSEAAVDLAVRPLGNEFLSFFGDYVFQEDLPKEAVNWSAGAAIEPVPGIRLVGRYFENKSFNLGLQFSFGNASISSEMQFDKNADRSNNIYGIRIGGYDRNPFRGILNKKDYAKIDLNGDMNYQHYRFFDDSNTLLELIKQIDAAKNDNSISGIVINASGMNINKEMLWELREKLAEFKKSGKHVVIFIDRADITGYQFASVADKIVMDPEGQILLQGFLFGRQYYQGTLQKIGIGFTELRYFKYKSADETFSRKNMSDADSIQWKKYVDDEYSLAKNEICTSRNIPPKKYDLLIDSIALFTAQTALENNLVDKLGRWEEVKEVIKDIEGENKGEVSPGSLAEFNMPDDNYWGTKPEIAVVYAVGVCAMDEGIKARSLSKVIEAITNNNNIKALVFRVDSPGGDGMASDVVAEALRKCKEKKPVIVSQGYVAGSGGYWISMYGDTIIAAPNTITGSIGVIAGWYYNKGFEEKLGVSTDYVKRGEHSDLFFGMSIPFTGIALPNRDMSSDEKNKVEKIIKMYYKEFVNKVSEGRKLSFSYVDSIGQGRIWSGTDGYKNKLVDELGGLSDAIKIAVDKAGLKDREYNVVEYPAPPLINIGLFTPKLFHIGTKTSAFLEQLKFRLNNNLNPLYILPMDYMDYYLSSLSRLP